MDYLSYLPAIRCLSTQSDKFQSSLNSLQSLIKPSQTHYNRHIASRKEVLRLAALNALQAGECAKKAIQTSGTALVQTVKRSNPRVALLSTRTELIRVAKLILAAVASLALGLVHPAWSLRVCQQLSLDKPSSFCAIVAQKALSVVRGVVQNKVIFGLGVVGILAYSLKSRFSVVDIDVNPAKVAEYSVAAQALLGVVGFGLAGLGAVKGLEHYRRKQQAAADLAAVLEKLNGIAPNKWIQVGSTVGRFRGTLPVWAFLLPFAEQQLLVGLNYLKPDDVRQLTLHETDLANKACLFRNQEVRLCNRGEWNGVSRRLAIVGKIEGLTPEGVKLSTEEQIIPYERIQGIEKVTEADGKVNEGYGTQVIETGMKRQNDKGNLSSDNEDD